MHFIIIFTKKVITELLNYKEEQHLISHHKINVQVKVSKTKELITKEKIPLSSPNFHKSNNKSCSENQYAGYHDKCTKHTNIPNISLMSLALSPIYLSTIALDTTLKHKMKKWLENKTSFKEVTTQ